MKIPDARRIGWHLLVMSLLALSAIGWSPSANAADQGPPEDWTPLDPALLASIRGGYALPSGLVVSFGFERLAWVDGELVASLRISIPDLARITPDQARQLARLRDTQLVQIGAGNVADTVAGGGAGLVIQNTLDGVHIRVATTLDASSNALGLLQAVNFSDALGQAGLAAPGTL